MFQKLFSRGKEESNGRSQSADNAPLIELRNVVKAYETPVGDFLALKSINLTVDHGEFVAVIGKSGSGKTTLVNMITGIDRPTSGEVIIGGKPIHNLSEGAMAEWRGRNVGIIFQFFQLLPMLTNIENVMLPMDFAGTFNGQKSWRERSLDLLDQVEIKEHAFKLPSEISGGQQQRVAIARSMANDPPILVADEPTGNLDQKTAENVFRIFEQAVSSGKTIFMVTHDRDLARRVNRTIILADGEIIDEFNASTFPLMPEGKLETMLPKLEPIVYEPDRVIVDEMTDAEKVYVVTDGAMEIQLVDSAGSNVLVARLRPGQYCGEKALLRGGNRQAIVQASAKEGASVATLSKSEWEKLQADS